MGGLAAILQTDGAPADAEALVPLTAAMAHRALDGVTVATHGPAALAHCRTCTTAESLAERQPVANEDGSLALILDGCLANWDDLRRSLLALGHQLRDSSDAELVLRAFEQWGETAPNHLEGQFAVVAWDAVGRRLIACTDHQALRPLYWHHGPRQVILATEMAALVAALGHIPPVNHGYLAEVLAEDYYSTADTVWQGISRLPAAHIMILENGQARIREYWRPETRADIRYRDLGQYAEHYREILFDSVRGAARSHLPVAFEVSGGLDSSALFGVAHELEKQGRLPAPGIRGYTLAGVPGTQSWEMPYLDMVAQHTGRTIHREPMTLRSLEGYQATARRDCDLPLRPNLAMAEAMHARMGMDGCRVVINGLGGDQWLDGSFNYYFEMLASRRWGKLAASYRSDRRVFGTRFATAMLLRYGLWQFAPGSLRRWKQDCDERRGRGWLARNGWLADSTLAELARRREQYLSTMPTERRDRYKLETLFEPYLPVALAHMDRQLSRCGLEPRSPMLSRRFIEFCAALPEEMRLQGGVTKRIHREAMRGILPEAVRTRADKADFTNAIDHNHADLVRFLARPMPPVILNAVRPGHLAELTEKFCTAPIDQRPYWPVWAIYEYVLTLSLSDSHAALQHGELETD